MLGWQDEGRRGTASAAEGVSDIEMRGRRSRRREKTNGETMRVQGSTTTVTTTEPLASASQNDQSSVRTLTTKPGSRGLFLMQQNFTFHPRKMHSVFCKEYF